MIVTLHTEHLTSLEQIERFLDGTAEIDFRAPDRSARRDWIEHVLRQFRYAQRSRRERGLLLRFLTKVTGYSPAQMKRLLKQFRTERHLNDRRGPPAKPFAYRYTVADQQALALHGNLSGPAPRKLAERAFSLFGDARYQRLAGISVAPICITCAVLPAISAFRLISELELTGRASPPMIFATRDSVPPDDSRTSRLARCTAGWRRGSVDALCADHPRRIEHAACHPAAATALAAITDTRWARYSADPCRSLLR